LEGLLIVAGDVEHPGHKFEHLPPGTEGREHNDKEI